MHWKPDFRNDVIVCVFDDFCPEDIFIGCVRVLVCAYVYVCVCVCERVCVCVWTYGRVLAFVCIACMSIFQYKQLICMHNIHVIPACSIRVFDSRYGRK